jgi:hypothetical protein
MSSRIQDGGSALAFSWMSKHSALSKKARTAGVSELQHFGHRSAGFSNYIYLCH